MRRVFVFIMSINLFLLSGCAELGQIGSQLPNGTLSNADIADGLKEALDKGIDKEVTKLTQIHGFYRNELVKISFPEELQKVDSALRKAGFGTLADGGLKVMNRAAEDAVKEAMPIFVKAVKSMTFKDARNILLGNDSAATDYLERTTSSQLYAKFNPIIKSSFYKVRADEVWNAIITKYKHITPVEDINLNNPDLTDYVTNEALEGVFTMIAIEEKNIRTNLSSRTSDLLKKVFALQD